MSKARKTTVESPSAPGEPHAAIRSFCDPEELSESIPEVDGEYIQVGRGDFRGQVVRSQLGQVTLHQTYTSPEVVCNMAMPASVLILGTALDHDGELLVYGKHLERRQLFIPDGEFVRHGRSFAGAWIGVSREHFEATVCALLGVDEVRIPRGFVVEHEALARALTGTIAAHVDAVQRHPERFADPVIRSAAEHMLLSRALDVVVAMCETARAQEHLPYGKAKIVRIASEYFDAHADERVSLADLAKVAAASARSLNYAFQDLVGMSPMRYFRMKRLGRARSKLVQASPQRGAVKQAALSAGYTHLGRFSAEYHELFGELPSVTLADR